MVIGIEVNCEPEEVKHLAFKKDYKGTSSISEAENGSGEKNARKSYTSTAHTLINDAELVEGTRKRTVQRSRTYDSSLNLDMKNELKLERKKTSSQSFKANAHFHKIFKDIPKEESLKESFACALQKEILYHGKLYISENWICFHSKVFGKDTKIVIPVLAVTLIKKTKTALLVPNALIVATITERFIFVSLLSRDSTYKLILSVCTHLENVSTGNSPSPSPAVHSYRTDRPGSYPLDFNDFSELDGLVASRRKEVEECSSTGSQTAESENSQEFSERDRNNLTKSQQTLVRTDRPNKQPQEKNCVTEQRPGLPRLGKRVDIWKIMSLNGLLFFYAILVCLLMFSTFYMQSRIGNIEEQLSSLHSTQNVWPVEHAPKDWNLNANGICNELTSNLEKLDKIQRNLQQLLEDSE